MVTSSDALRPVRFWLYAVAALVFVMVLVGGATRLTESGLSITEWKPVTGALPPLSETEWQTEFAKYQEIPQYRVVNKGMTLDEFKTIFWWEWGHRLLGRLIGFAFAIPFAIFLITGRIGRRHLVPLGSLMVLGGLQGFVGWYMVKSGLVDRVSVSQYRLAIHLTLALIIFAAILWVARGLAPERAAVTRNPRLRLTAWTILGLTFVQLFLGALVAGLDAGLAYPTWPLMDGDFIPPISSLLVMDPAWKNFFENVLTVQFLHRMTAYLLIIVAVVHAFDASDSPIRNTAWLFVGGLLVQATLGVLTLLHAVPISLALLHQGGAVFVLAIATLHLKKAENPRSLDSLPVAGNVEAIQR